MSFPRVKLFVMFYLSLVLAVDGSDNELTQWANHGKSSL